MPVNLGKRIGKDLQNSIAFLEKACLVCCIWDNFGEEIVLNIGNDNDELRSESVILIKLTNALSSDHYGSAVLVVSDILKCTE